MFDNSKFESAITEVAHHYEKSAPIIETWCDWMMTAKSSEITLSDILLLQYLNDKTQSPLSGNSAANKLYHHQSLLGRDTTGMAGF